jgi:hypothetical protein
MYVCRYELGWFWTFDVMYVSRYDGCHELVNLCVEVVYLWSHEYANVWTCNVCCVNLFYWLFWLRPVKLGELLAIWALHQSRQSVWRDWCTFQESRQTLWHDSQSRHGSTWLRKSMPTRATLIGATAHATYLHNTVTLGPVTPGEVARSHRTPRPSLADWTGATSYLQ